MTGPVALLEIQSNDLSIVAVTGEYFVVDSGKNGVVTWNVKQRTPIPSRLNIADARKLFVTETPVAVEVPVKWPHQIESDYGKLLFRVEQRTYEKYERVGGSQWSPGHNEWVKKFSGKIIVSRADTTLASGDAGAMLTSAGAG